MTLTKSQKIYVGLLGVGLAALAADHAFGSGAAGEAAGSIVIDPAGRSTPPAGAAGPVVGPTAFVAPGASVHGDRTVASRLRELPAGGDSVVRDAFSAPPAWKAPPVALAAAAAATPAPPDPGVRFKATHTLKAVIGTGGRGHVMVDDHFLAVGQWIDGFRLVRVTSTDAFFSAGGDDVVLTLPGATAAGRP